MDIRHAMVLLFESSRRAEEYQLLGFVLREE